MVNESSSGLHVAIIGCGIVGVQLGLGLLKRNINVTLYEQAAELREIGAGIGFMSPATHCMQALDERIFETLTSIGLRVDDPMRYMDGSSQEDFRLRSGDQMYDMGVTLPDLHVKTCSRAKLLIALVKLLPSGVLRLGRRLERIDQDTSDGRVQITFSDGEQVATDAGE